MLINRLSELPRAQKLSSLFQGIILPPLIDLGVSTGDPGPKVTVERAKKRPGDHLLFIEIPDHPGHGEEASPPPWCTGVQGAGCSHCNTEVKETTTPPRQVLPPPLPSPPAGSSCQASRPRSRGSSFW